MRSVRKSIVLAAVSMALLIPLESAFAGRGGRGGGGGGRGGGGGGRGGGGNMQQQQNPQNNAAVVADRNEINTITANLKQISTDLSTAVDKITSDYQKTPDWTDAQKALDAASSEVTKAREAVMAKLKLTPAYKTAAGKESAAKAKLDQIRSNGGSRDAISAQSTIILNLGGETSKLEKDALDADGNYQDAMKKLAAANTVMKDLKDALAKMLQADATVATLKQSQADAQKKLTDANTKLSTDLRNAGG